MYPSPDSAEQPADSDSSAEQLDHYCSMYSSKPPPPAEKRAVCNQACLGPVIWTKHEVPRPTCGKTCFQKTWHLQGITRGDDRDQGERHSGLRHPASHSQRQGPMHLFSGSAGRPADQSSTTATQYCLLGYFHEEVTSVPWETSVPTPPLDQHCLMGYSHEEVTPVHSADRNSGLRQSAKSSAERLALWPRARCLPEDLRELLRERYHPPGYPKGLGGSRHLDGRTAADASRQNGFGSAEQSAPLPKAVSLVPVSSPQLNTGLRESNPQSGDLVPCYGAKQPPPHVHRNPLASDSPRFKAPPPNSSLPLPLAGLYHATSFIHGHRGPPPSLGSAGKQTGA